jgi:hypothetical protein
LIEFLATLYKAHPETLPWGAKYEWNNDLVPFPDFARIEIHRLKGQSAEVLHVNVSEILKSGDVSKDVALQGGDMVEIPQQEHKVADRWAALSPADVTALNKFLLRTVRMVVQGKTNLVALVPSLAVAQGGTMGFLGPTPLTLDLGTDWLTEALHGGKPDTVVTSFLLDNVVRDGKVLLNTWDLSRVRLTRGGANTTFDLTANPAPEVWLEDGDVIEIPELGEAAPAAGATESPQPAGLH